MLIHVPRSSVIQIHPPEDSQLQRHLLCEAFLPSFSMLTAAWVVPIKASLTHSLSCSFTVCLLCYPVSSWRTRPQSDSPLSYQMLSTRSVREQAQARFTEWINNEHWVTDPASTAWDVPRLCTFTLKYRNPGLFSPSGNQSFLPGSPFFSRTITSLQASIPCFLWFLPILPFRPVFTSHLIQGQNNPLILLLHLHSTADAQLRQLESTVPLQAIAPISWTPMSFVLCSLLQNY